MVVFYWFVDICHIINVGMLLLASYQSTHWSRRLVIRNWEYSLAKHEFICLIFIFWSWQKGTLLGSAGCSCGCSSQQVNFTVDVTCCSRSRSLKELKRAVPNMLSPVLNSSWPFNILNWSLPVMSGRYYTRRACCGDTPREAQATADRCCRAYGTHDCYARSKSVSRPYQGL